MRGGEVVAMGRPEEVAQVERSHTGRLAAHRAPCVRRDGVRATRARTARPPRGLGTTRPLCLTAFRGSGNFEGLFPSSSAR